MHIIEKVAIEAFLNALFLVTLIHSILSYALSWYIYKSIKIMYDFTIISQFVTCEDVISLTSIEGILFSQLPMILNKYMSKYRSSLFIYKYYSGNIIEECVFFQLSSSYLRYLSMLAFALWDHLKPSALQVEGPELCSLYIGQEFPSCVRTQQQSFWPLTNIPTQSLVDSSRILHVEHKIADIASYPLHQWPMKYFMATINCSAFISILICFMPCSNSDFATLIFRFNSVFVDMFTSRVVTQRNTCIT